MAELLVCIKCRAEDEVPEGGERPGEALYKAVIAQELPETVQVTPTECLQNCDSGCSVALRDGVQQWTYVYGNLGPQDADMLVQGARQYSETPDGVIPWRQRPEHFKRNCVARIPPLVPAEKDETL